MFLQSVTGREQTGGGGGVYLKRHPPPHDPSFPPSRPSYGHERSYPPSTTDSPTYSISAATSCRMGSGATQNGLRSRKRAPSGPRSPPQSPTSTTAALPGKSSLGVFLQNCQASGDFVQLRTDRLSRAQNNHVRLYLTATELVKKSMYGDGASRLVQHTAESAGQDFMISRHPLQDVRVTASKVSPATLVVSLLAPIEPSYDAGGNVTVEEQSGGVVSDTGRMSSPTVHATNGRPHTHYYGNEYSYYCNGTREYDSTAYRERATLVVEAYQLQEATEGSACIRDWIANVERNKRKLEMLHRLKQTSTSATQNSSSTEPLSPSLPPPSPPRPSNQIPNTTTTTTTTTATRISSRRQRSREDPALYRRSHSGFEISNFASPNRDKFPTTSNGRYTPLHHHYTPHSLFSNSQPQKNDRQTNDTAVVRLRQRQGGRKEPFRLLRRLSLGSGTSGSYCFPPSPDHTASSGRTEGVVEAKSGRTRTNGRTTYMYSLSQDAVSPSVPSPSVSEFENASPWQQATPNVNGDAVGWKNRQTSLSRSISENHSDSDCGSNFTGTGVSAAEETEHQTSEPLPISGATNNTDYSTGHHVSSEGSSEKDDGVPPELRALQSLLTNLTPSQNSPSTTHRQHSTESTTSHTPSDNDDDDEVGFQSFLFRHKQIRGRKVHVSPRAHSASSELLSPPDRFSIHSPASSHTTTSETSNSRTTKAGSSATLPRGHKVKVDSNSTTTTGARTSKTLDREGKWVDPWVIR